ncbi:lytic polysaccharide monooxygenase [Melanomma pulvis-pyrius CBS 109.77]|uniref:lytic cellulose monooxygenase (C4-dehydrogenating) n=1 Tax=Melanomma pulvis-pyrius CBS 109.77 TaxID=1314802 RepID=A0A6A6WXH5_9PLEO|nr:lytic polysaccharide monooxygenase [Melanomma pulvis-pyrius CBS 109.77]
MHFPTPLLLLSSVVAVNAHYRFSRLVLPTGPETAEWTSIRQTKNYQANFGVTSVDSADMRCFQNKPGTGTATIKAGETLGFIANAEVSHFGPVQFYMARVPEGKE